MSQVSSETAEASPYEPFGKRRGQLARTTGAFAGVATLLAVMLAGCGPKEDLAPKAQEEAKQLFYEGKGLKLLPETQRSLGLKTASAGPQTLRREIVATAQAFLCFTNETGAVCVQASAFVPASIARPQTGAPVELRSIGSVDPLANGVVVRVDETTRAAFGQLEVVVEWHNRAGPLAVGRFLEARLTSGPMTADVAVPHGALVRAALGDFVYAVEEEFLNRVPVKVGTEDATWVEIRSGLKSGSTVVTQGAQSLWLLELSEVGGMANIK